MADHLLAEALARVEYKLDLMMKAMGIAMPPPMHFIGVHNCPACGRVVDHQIDIQHQVVKRICGCSTGKQPVILPILPTQQGATNVRNEPASAEGEAGAQNGPRRQEGGPGPRHVR